MLETLLIRNNTKGKLPGLPFLELKNEILGKKYSLSIAYVNEAESRKLNKKWRGKDKATNVLSFSLAKNSGELVLCPSVAKKEAKNFDKTFPKFLGFLVIHGMLHLKGLEHSSRMDKQEVKYDKKYFSGNRRRLTDNSGSRGRVHKRRKNS